MRLSHLRSEGVHRELLVLIKQFAFAHREVTLNSGQKSNFYIDCKQVSMRPDGAFALGRLFFEGLLHIEDAEDVHFDVCGGMAMGALPLSIALTLAAFSRNRDLPTLSVRKEVKDHGTKSSIEGPVQSLSQGQILLDEDVVTTGKATIQAAKTLREAGFVVEHGLAIVDREAGGQANLESESLQLFSLFDLSDLGVRQ